MDRDKQAYTTQKLLQKVSAHYRVYVREGQTEVQVQGLEALGQQPFQMGATLGQTASTAGARAGALGLEGANISQRLATGAAATTNPYSTALGGVASNPAFGQLLGGLFSNVPTTAMSAPATTFGTGNYYGNQDLGLYL